MRQGLIQAMELLHDREAMEREADELLMLNYTEINNTDKPDTINAEQPDSVVVGGECLVDVIKASKEATDTLRTLNGLKLGDCIDVIYVEQKLKEGDALQSFENLFRTYHGKILDKVMLDNPSANQLGKEFIFLVEGQGFLASVVHSSTQPELRSQPELFKEGFYILEKRDVKRGMNAVPRGVLLKKLWGKLNKNASSL